MKSSQLPNESDCQPFSERLRAHGGLADFANQAVGAIDSLRRVLKAGLKAHLWSTVSIYAVGSLARRELTTGSDLDLYALSDSSSLAGHLEFPLATLELVREVAAYPIDQKCLRSFSGKQLGEAIGTGIDDSSNTFTARLLWALESTPLSNPDVYEQVSLEIAQAYFRRFTGRDEKHPAAFLNDDLIRYWKTLCVNFEVSSYGGTRPVGVKRLSLKFSRPLSVFATVLYVRSVPNFGVNELVRLLPYTPFERLAMALDKIGDLSLLARFGAALDLYCSFLELKSRPHVEEYLARDSRLAADWSAKGDRFLEFLAEALTKKLTPQQAIRLLLL